MFVYLQMLPEEEHEKFILLYNAYKRLMYKVAYDILENEQDAEDAVSGAFVKICESFEKIGEPVCPRTRSFLVMVTESRAIDIYRRRQRFEMVPFEEAFMGMSYEWDGADLLTARLLGLPARYREVLILKFQNNLDDKTIGKLLGLSANYVRLLEKRALDKLREIYREEGAAC